MSSLVAVAPFVDLVLDGAPSLPQRIRAVLFKGLVFIKLKQQHIVAIALLMLLTLVNVVKVKVFLHVYNGLLLNGRVIIGLILSYLIIPEYLLFIVIWVRYKGLRCFYFVFAKEGNVLRFCHICGVNGVH